MTSKFLPLASVALALICVKSCVGFAKPSSSEIQVACNNLFGVAPLRQLTTALRQHPHARIFRVIWNTDGTLGRVVGYALYNRKTHTLKLADKEWWRSYPPGDIEENFPINTESDDQWIYGGVTDAKLVQLWEKVHRPNLANPNDDAKLCYFPRLSQLGCKKKSIKHYKKATTTRK